MGKAGIIIFSIHLVIGVYLLNLVFNFYKIPEAISQFNEFITLIGGILILLGGIRYLRFGRGKNYLAYPGF